MVSISLVLLKLVEVKEFSSSENLAQDPLQELWETETPLRLGFKVGQTQWLIEKEQKRN